MTKKRYIYTNIGIGYGYEILDSWFGYTGDDEPTEQEIETHDYLVIGLASNQDAAEGICRRLNDQQDEINHLSNFGLHVILDKKNKENEELKQRNDRQAKQLDRLYGLIEEKDWTALSDIIDDFKRCEEQLQKEWGIYNESE